MGSHPELVQGLSNIGLNTIWRNADPDIFQDHFACKDKPQYIAIASLICSLVIPLCRL
jgi:hypothetical protein